MTDLPLLAFAAGTFLLAGFIKGVIGLGLPTVAMGLLGTAMPPAQAAAMLVVPSLVTNVWQMAAGPPLRPLARRLWPMLAGVCLGTWAGAGWLTGGGGAEAGLGAALVAYAALGLAPVRLPRVPGGAETWAGPLVGAVTGLVTAATGVFVIPAVPYLGALGLDRDRLVQALGLSFTASTLALAANLAGSGALGAAPAGGSLLALAPTLAGMLLGGRVRAWVRPETFRRGFFLALLALGANLLVRGLS